MIVPFFQYRDFPPGIKLATREAFLLSNEKENYILGEEVTAFEKAFANYVGSKHCIGVGNGYDALVLSLRALEIRPTDEVIVAANGYAATMNAVIHAGGKLVLVDADINTYNLEAAQAENAISESTRVILPIHLYGQPCYMPGLLKVAEKCNAVTVEDCAQAHGASISSRKVGTFGQLNAFSYYPTKNLGAIGDAGAIITDEAPNAAYLRKYRNYGQQDRYTFEHIGINSRLDTVQAAVLLEKLPYLNQMNAERKRLAAIYDNELSGLGDLILPFVSPGVEHVYHLYVVRTPRRNALQQYLQQKGIQTLIHYPVPPHLQPAYRHLGYRKGDFPIAEELAETSLSLPLFPGLTESEQQYVITQLKHFFQ